MNTTALYLLDLMLSAPDSELDDRTRTKISNLNSCSDPKHELEKIIDECHEYSLISNSDMLTLSIIFTMLGSDSDE